MCDVLSTGVHNRIYSILAQYTLNNNVNWILHYMYRPYMRLFVVFNKVILNEGHSKDYLLCPCACSIFQAKILSCLPIALDTIVCLYILKPSPDTSVCTV